MHSPALIPTVDIARWCFGDDKLYPRCLELMVGSGRGILTLVSVSAYRLNGATVDLAGLPHG